MLGRREIIFSDIFQFLLILEHPTLFVFLAIMNIIVELCYSLRMIFAARIISIFPREDILEFFIHLIFEGCIYAHPLGPYINVFLLILWLFTLLFQYFLLKFRKLFFLSGGKFMVFRFGTLYLSSYQGGLCIIMEHLLEANILKVLDLNANEVSFKVVLCKSYELLQL